MTQPPAGTLAEMIQNLLASKPDASAEAALDILLDQIDAGGWRTVLAPLVEIELRREMLDQRSLAAEHEHSDE